MTPELKSDILELIDELRGYCADSWDWKYGERWDAEREAIRAALATRQPQHAPQFAIGFSMLCVAVGVATGVAWLLGAL